MVLLLLRNNADPLKEPFSGRMDNSTVDSPLYFAIIQNYRKMIKIMIGYRFSGYSPKEIDYVIQQLNFSEYHYRHINLDQLENMILKILIDNYFD